MGMHSNAPPWSYSPGYGPLQHGKMGLIESSRKITVEEWAVARAAHRRMVGTVSIVGLCIFCVSANPAWTADKDSRVVEAARKNDTAGVRTYIKDHGDVNTPQGDGSTALLWAAYHSNLDMARALLAAGADFKAANRLGVTPLLMACRLGSSSIVEMLLSAWRRSLKASIREGKPF